MERDRSPGRRPPPTGIRKGAGPAAVWRPASARPPSHRRTSPRVSKGSVLRRHLLRAAWSQGGRGRPGAPRATAASTVRRSRCSFQDDGLWPARIPEGGEASAVDGFVPRSARGPPPRWWSCRPIAMLRPIPDGFAKLGRPPGGPAREQHRFSDLLARRTTDSATTILAADSVARCRNGPAAAGIAMPGSLAKCRNAAAVGRPAYRDVGPTCDADVQPIPFFAFEGARGGLGRAGFARASTIGRDVLGERINLVQAGYHARTVGRLDLDRVTRTVISGHRWKRWCERHRQNQGHPNLACATTSHRHQPQRNQAAQT